MIRKNIIILIAGSLLTVNIAVAQLADPQKESAAIPGLTSEQTDALVEMQNIMRLLNRDPKFKELLDETNELARKIDQCPKTGSAATACKTKLNEERKKLLKRAEQMRDEKLAPIKDQLKGLYMPYKKQ